MFSFSKSLFPDFLPRQFPRETRVHNSQCLSIRTELLDGRIFIHPPCCLWHPKNFSKGSWQSSESTPHQVVKTNTCHCMEKVYHMHLIHVHGTELLDGRIAGISGYHAMIQYLLCIYMYE